MAPEYPLAGGATFPVCLLMYTAVAALHSVEFRKWFVLGSAFDMVSNMLMSPQVLLPSRLLTLHPEWYVRLCHLLCD